VYIMIMIVMIITMIMIMIIMIMMIIIMMMFTIMIYINTCFVDGWRKGSRYLNTEFLCSLLMPYWLSLCVLRRTCRENRLYETLFHTVIILNEHHHCYTCIDRGYEFTHLCRCYCLCVTRALQSLCHTYIYIYIYIYVYLH
jgi:hypothetical protein